MSPERPYELAHLGHVELFTPKPEESLHFFVHVLGLTESGREGDSFICGAGTITSSTR